MTAVHDSLRPGSPQAVARTVADGVFGAGVTRGRAVVRRFGLGGVTVRFTTDDALSMSYAADGLPGFADIPRLDDFHVDDLTVPQVDLLDLVGALGGLDNGLRCRPTRSSTMVELTLGDDTFYYEPGAAPDHVLCRRGDRLLVACAPGASRFRYGFRYLREIFYRCLRGRGHVVFHAGSVRLADGRVVLIAGDSGAGKTTTALALCRWGSARLVANERTLLHWSPAGWSVLGLPSAVRMDRATMSLFGWAGWSDETAWRPGVYRGKHERMPGELRRYAGIASVDGGPLAALLLPGTEPGRPGAAEEVLRRNCYHPVDPHWPEDWLHIGDCGDDDGSGDVSTLLATTTVVEIPRSMPLPGLTRALIDQLT